MSEINYKLANFDTVNNSKRLSSFPNYFNRGQTEELISMDTLADWETTIGNTGDVVEVVKQIDTTLWSDENVERINPTIPNGKFSCIKVDGHLGTGISRIFSEPINLDGKSLGIYAFIDTLGSTVPPSRYSDVVDIRLHSGNDSNAYRFRLQVRNSFDNGWFLFSLQPVDYSKLGTPDLSEIHGIQILSGLPTTENATFYLSSLLSFPNTLDRGKILIDFDDNFLSFYTEAYKYMTGKYGYQGTLFINGSRTDSSYVTVNQMLRMQDDGWVIGNHTWVHKNWRDQPFEEQQKNLIKNMDWMAEQGFWYGNQVFATTNYTLDYNMLKNLKDNGFKMIRSGYYNGRGAYLSLPVINNPMGQPLPSNELNNTVSVETWKTHLADVANSKAIAIHTFHNLSDSSSTTVAHFKALIDEIQNYDVDVITYADLLTGNI